MKGIIVIQSKLNTYWYTYTWTILKSGRGIGARLGWKDYSIGQQVLVPKPPNHDKEKDIRGLKAIGPNIA